MTGVVYGEIRNWRKIRELGQLDAADAANAALALEATPIGSMLLAALKSAAVARALWRAAPKGETSARFEAVLNAEEEIDVITQRMFHDAIRQALSGAT